MLYGDLNFLSTGLGVLNSHFTFLNSRYIWRKLFFESRYSSFGIVVFREIAYF